MRRALIGIAILASIPGCAGPQAELRQGTSPPEPPDNAPYMDPDRPTQERVEDLLERMTLEEKLGQMTQIDRQFLGRPEDIRRYKLGSILSGGGSTPDENTPDAWADMYDMFQQEALDTRLGIPILYGTDAVHGHNNLRDATIFPHNIGLGAARNEQLVEDIARATAREMTGTGMRWNFAPAVAVVRDIRWGRSYEGFSEEPELVSELGAAALRGYQHGSPDNSDWVLATPKHWVGDGGTDGGEDQGDTELPLDELVTIHGAPYGPAIDAGARVIMASYNSWNGEKAHGSRTLLTDVLRGDFGFDGMILSDWGAIYQLPGGERDQTLQSIEAGIDMNMVPDDYQSFIDTTRDLVETGALSRSRIDEAVRRILTIKFEMGLFEKPFADREYQDTVRSDEHLELAEKAVRESQVLLRNEDHILPIDDEVDHIHVTGRFADDIGAQSGGWTIEWQGVRGNNTEGTSVLDAVTDRAGSGIDVTHSASAENAGDDMERADVIIAVVGEEPYAESEGDRSRPELHGQDIDLLETASKADTPVVAVLLSGRPLVLTDELGTMDALLASWLPGTEASGIAEILFGDSEPTGRLPMTWPRRNDQIPLQVDGDTGGTWTTEEAHDAGFGVVGEEYEELPLFPYGFGLGYSSGLY